MRWFVYKWKFINLIVKNVLCLQTLYEKSYDLNTDLYLDYFLSALLRIQLGAWYDALKELPPRRQWVKTESNWKLDLLPSKPIETDRGRKLPPTQPYSKQFDVIVPEIYLVTVFVF